MANWIYKVDIKTMWDKYSDYSHEDYDENAELFSKMKLDLTEGVLRQLRPADASNVKDIITKLKNAKHLSTFNNHWNTLYDYFDSRKIWLATYF